MKTKNNFFSKKKLLILELATSGLLFVFSIYARAPFLNQSLSYNHEWLTSTSLRTMQIWHQEGIFRHSLNPIMTYSGLANRFIDNQASVMDSQGRFYYTSYPPFAYIFPYFIFSILGIYPNVLGIQIFNLALHFICGLFVYLIIREISNKRHFNLPALAAASLYFFSVETLWIHFRVYMSDILIQPLFLITLFSVIKYLKNLNSQKYLFISTLFIFLMVYTEWLGLFFALTLVGYLVFRIAKFSKSFSPDSKQACCLSRSEEKNKFSSSLTSLDNKNLIKKYKSFLKFIIISATLALSTMILQYSSIAGPKNYLNASLTKFKFRSGLSESIQSENIYHLANWKKIYEHYEIGYEYFISILLISVIVFIFSNSFHSKIFNKKEQKFDQNQKLILALALLPVIMHHLIFFNFTSIHSFSVLKTAIFFSLFLGLVLAKIINKSRGDWQRVALKLVIVVIIFAAIFNSINKYKTLANSRNDSFKIAGQKMKQIAKDDEVVFLHTNDPYVVPQAVFYVERNMAKWEGEEKAKKLIKKIGAKRGIMFVLNDAGTEIQEYNYID